MVMSRRPSKIAIIALLAALTAPSFALQAEHQAEFSFWGNLRMNRQADAGVTSSSELHELSSEVASRCCAVRPGQPVTLVVGGKVVLCGTVQAIYAGSVPRAGDDRLVFFEVEGPDGRNREINPLGFLPEYSNANYELFVVGPVSVAALSLAPRSWSSEVDFAAVVDRAVRTRVLDPFWFPENISGSKESFAAATPDAIAELLENEADLSEYSVPSGAESVFVVQVLRRPSAKSVHGFVRVVGGGLAESVLLRGLLDYFLLVDGVPHMVMRDARAGTGMWKYAVYCLTPEVGPQLVHEDGSWSN